MKISGRSSSLGRKKNMRNGLGAAFVRIIKLRGRCPTNKKNVAFRRIALFVEADRNSYKIEGGGESLLRNPPPRGSKDRACTSARSEHWQGKLTLGWFPDSQWISIALVADPR